MGFELAQPNLHVTDMKRGLDARHPAPFFVYADLNWGKLNSGVISSQVTWTGMSILTSSGLQSTILESMRMCSAL